MKNLKYIISLMLVACFAITSCSDPDIDLPAADDDELSSPFENSPEGPSLGITITLDDMGGRATDPNDPLWEYENYVDLEKIRVLFFDSKDDFLFESRSRWVKQIEHSYNNSRWYMSVPFFTYGDEEDWDWERIKTAMTSGPFKIAILANRPRWEWAPNFDNNTGLDAHWFDNSGPNWGPAETGNRNVLDLHHVQYDPIYIGKGFDSNGKYQGFYKFIQGRDPNVQGGDDQKVYTQLGATSSWVDWGEHDKDNKNELGKGMRYFKHPTPDSNGGYEYPIPMYGIQQFAAIPEKDWPDGTTYNLTRDENGIKDNPISLLRSVVKLELRLPSSIQFSDIEYVLLWYPNVYARCEPINVWDPTDQIWAKTHNATDCEQELIRQYGRLCKRSDYNTNTAPNSPKYATDNTTPVHGSTPVGTVEDCKRQYQNRMSWFYGAWYEKGWRWNGENVQLPPKINNRYLQIFNPCIQRNQVVDCARVYTGSYGGYHHWVVYTGERGINDPSVLDRLSGEGTVCYWQFRIKKNTKDDQNRDMTGVTYSVPLSKYFGDVTYRNIKTKGEENNYALDGDEKLTIPSIDKTTITKNTSHKNYADDQRNTGSGQTNYMANYFRAVQDMENVNQLPIPLMRNHIYRFTVSNINTLAKTRGSEDAADDIVVDMQEAYTEDISFK